MKLIPSEMWIMKWGKVFGWLMVIAMLWALAASCKTSRKIEESIASGSSFTGSQGTSVKADSVFQSLVWSIDTVSQTKDVEIIYFDTDKTDSLTNTHPVSHIVHYTSKTNRTQKTAAVQNAASSIEVKDSSNIIARDTVFAQKKEDKTVKPSASWNISTVIAWLLVIIAAAIFGKIVIKKYL